MNEPQILSTYRPVHGQNLFQLSLDEGSALGVGGPAVALVLSPSAILLFVGAYRRHVLRGSISLLGKAIQPSRVIHPIFAPWSSPIPVIEVLVAHVKRRRCPSRPQTRTSSRTLSSRSTRRTPVFHPSCSCGTTSRPAALRMHCACAPRLHCFIPLIPL
jgi:hypothetical protein